MATPATTTSTTPPGRRAILDLAPLELDCMNALWQLGAANVREIRERLAASKPRAYTTIMTIMDRLAAKGAVTRHKVGRAYRYQPNVTAGEARARAVDSVVEHFFGGSAPALVEHLAGEEPARAAQPARPEGRKQKLEVGGSKVERVSPQEPSSAAPEPVEPTTPKMDEVLL